MGDLNVDKWARRTTKFRHLTTFLDDCGLEYLHTDGLIDDKISDHTPVFLVKKQQKIRHPTPLLLP